VREDARVSFRLDVDAARWRTAVDRAIEAEPRLVPVIKGNGYGFGNHRLAAEAARVKVDTIAVGTADEASALRAHYTGDVLVLTPWHPSINEAAPATSARGATITTLAHPEAVLALAGRSAGSPVVVEVLTSMRRHGIEPRDLPLLMRPLESLDVRGFALHLPLDLPAGAAVAEVERWAGRLSDAGLRPRTLWVSHLSPTDLTSLRGSLPGADVRPRIGTSLWLGAKDALTVSGTVLDVHAIERGGRSGYRQRRAPKDGSVLVVSGGTAHGVGLEAPPSGQRLPDRGRSVARGGMEAVGLSRSPFRLGGKRLRFLEPPHMQVSMLWLPADVPAPVIGDRLLAQVRLTTSTFDAVHGL
jgi:hypothetical protein